MTPSEIITIARQGTNNESSTYFSDTELFSYLQIGINEAATESLILETKDTSLVSVASQSDYTLPTLLFEPKRIEYNGLKLRPSTFTELDKLTSAILEQPAATGTPRFYAIWQRTIKLAPTPDSSAQAITIFGYTYHDTITSSTTLLAPIEFHGRFVDYIMYRMMLKEGDISRAGSFKQIWDAHKSYMKVQMKARKRGDNFMIVQNEDQSISNVLGLV